MSDEESIAQEHTAQIKAVAESSKRKAAELKAELDRAKSSWQNYGRDREPRFGGIVSFPPRA